MYKEAVKDWMLTTLGPAADDVIKTNVDKIVGKLDDAELATLYLVAAYGEVLKATSGKAKSQ